MGPPITPKPYTPLSSLTDLIKPSSAKWLLTQPKEAIQWIWGILQGDFNENPSNSQIIARLLITIIPGVDTVGDVQDLAAALFKLIWQRRIADPGVWTDLVLTGIGFIPELGSVVKGSSKLIFKAILEGKKFDEIAVLLKKVGINDAAKFLSDLSKNLDVYGELAKKQLTSYLGKLSDFLENFKKLPGVPTEKIDELLKEIEVLKKKLPEEVDKTIAELKKRIEEILERKGETGIKVAQKKTIPTGQKGGKPTGKKTEVKGDKRTKSALEKENESADILANEGYKIEQNPGKLPNGRNPDYKIEGEYFDCYAPTTNNLDNIRNAISEKVTKGQADRIVLNLDNTSVTLEQVNEILLRKPKEGLQEIVGIKNGKIIPF